MEFDKSEQALFLIGVITALGCVAFGVVMEVISPLL